MVAARAGTLTVSSDSTLERCAVCLEDLPGPDGMVQWPGGCGHNFRPLCNRGLVQSGPGANHCPLCGIDQIGVRHACMGITILVALAVREVREGGGEGQLMRLADESWRPREAVRTRARARGAWLLRRPGRALRRSSTQLLSAPSLPAPGAGDMGRRPAAEPAAAPASGPVAAETAPDAAQDEAPWLCLEEWRLGGLCNIGLPGTGPPGMPSGLLAQVAEQLLPTAVVSSAAHALLACPKFGNRGFHCLPADPSGYNGVVHIETWWRAMRPKVRR